MRLGIRGLYKGVVVGGPENDKWRHERSFWWRFQGHGGERDLLRGVDISGIILIIHEQFQFFLTKGKGRGYNTLRYCTLYFLKVFFLIQYIKIIKNINKNVNSILFKVNIFLESIKNKNYHCSSNNYWEAITERVLILTKDQYEPLIFPSQTRCVLQSWLFFWFIVFRRPQATSLELTGQ